MAKYLVETFYTCSFKIIHKLDELNEKKLSDLQNRNDGKIEVIDVKLNNRKTKVIGNKVKDDNFYNNKENNKFGEISSVVSEKILKNENIKNIIPFFVNYTFVIM